MSTQAPANYTEWYRNLPIGWFTGGANGQSEATANGTIVDNYVALLKAGVKAREPDNAPVDALPHIGGDRQLIQGSNETNASFTTRLLDAWGQWSRAGTPCSVLEQLYYFGLSGAVWVQQNGLQYTLSGAPTPGQDPTGLVVASTATTLPATLTSSVAPYRQIPAGTPWVNFDGNTDMTNRFAIILPSGWPFASLTQVNFNNADSAVATWPVPFGSSTYSVIYGVPTDDVVISVDGTTQTKTSVTIRASAPWTGSLWVIAWSAGVNPLNTFSLASFGAVKRIIQTFRPNALCVGVYAYQNSKGAWGYPVRKWGNGDKWGATSVTQILGSF